MSKPSAERLAHDIAQDEADRVYEQCLVDARRMLRDEEYSTVVMQYVRGGLEDPPPGIR